MNDIEDVFVKRGVKESVQVASKDVKSEEGNKQGANFRGKTAKQKLLEKLLKSYEKPGIESKSAEKENRDIRKTSRSWRETLNSNGKSKSNDKRETLNSNGMLKSNNNRETLNSNGMLKSNNNRETLNSNGMLKSNNNRETLNGMLKGNRETQNSNGMLKKMKKNNDKRTNVSSSNRSSEGKTDVETIIEQVSEEQNFVEKHNDKKSISVGKAIRGSMNSGLKKNKKAEDSNEDSYSYEYHQYECTGDSNEDCSDEDEKEAAHIKLTSVV